MGLVTLPLLNAMCRIEIQSFHHQSFVAVLLLENNPLSLVECPYSLMRLLYYDALFYWGLFCVFLMRSHLNRYGGVIIKNIL